MNAQIYNVIMWASLCVGSLFLIIKSLYSEHVARRWRLKNGSPYYAKEGDEEWLGVNGVTMFFDVASKALLLWFIVMLIVGLTSEHVVISENPTKTVNYTLSSSTGKQGEIFVYNIDRDRVKFSVVKEKGAGKKFDVPLESVQFFYDCAETRTPYATEKATTRFCEAKFIFFHLYSYEETACLYELHLHPIKAAGS